MISIRCRQQSSAGSTAADISKNWLPLPVFPRFFTKSLLTACPAENFCKIDCGLSVLRGRAAWFFLLSVLAELWWAMITTACSLQVITPHWWWCIKWRLRNSCISLFLYKLLHCAGKYPSTVQLVRLKFVQGRDEFELSSIHWCYLQLKVVN